MSHYYNTFEDSKCDATELKRNAFRLQLALQFSAHLPLACHQHLGDRADSLFLTLHAFRKWGSSCWCTYVFVSLCPNSNSAAPYHWTVQQSNHVAMSFATAGLHKSITQFSTCIKCSVFLFLHHAPQHCRAFFNLGTHVNDHDTSDI